MPTALFRTSVIAGLIVALGGLVAGMEPGNGKTIGAEALASAPAAPAGDLCSGAAWPYLPAECLRSADGAPVPEVRWITIETRLSENESMLLAAPVAN